MKIPLYAEAGIAEVWLVDLNAGQIEVYRQPTAATYPEIRSFDRTQTIAIQAFADTEIAVSDLLGIR